MKPKLFSYFRSTCSYRVRIALHLGNIDFEYIPIHLINNSGEQHSESFQKLNPQRQVPVFVDHKVSLSQSMAILEYLDQEYLSKVLFPTDSVRRSHCIELCEIINSGVQPLQNLKVLQELKSRFNISEDQKTEWIRDWIEMGLSAYEKKIEKNAASYSMGEQLSAADLFLIPQLYNAHRFKADLSKFPHISKVEQKCLILEAFQKAHPDAQPDSPPDS